jgi:hypothetical protein
MIAFFSAVLPFCAAVAAWLVLEFLGRPFRRFFDLRGRVIFLLTFTGNVRAQYQEVKGTVDLRVVDLSPEEMDQLTEAVRSLREIASEMGSFAMNETLALWVVRKLGYDPASAANALMGSSNTRAMYGCQRVSHMERIVASLKLPSAGLSTF